MQYTVTINTVEIEVFNVSITETIDQTLDFGIMEIRNDREEPYKIGDYVRIVANYGEYSYYKADGSLGQAPKNISKTYDFIIEADVVMQMNEGVYRHRVSLIELTKRLENYTDTRRKFSQPSDPTKKKSLYDVVELLRMTVPIDFLDFASATRLFVVSQKVIDRLSAIEAPEFQFENKNLREMLNDVFEFANGIPRLKIENVAGDLFVLDGDFYNDLRELITENQEGSFSKTKQIDINNSASGLDSETANQVGQVVVEPSRDRFRNLTSPTGILDTDSAVMPTDFGIVEIEKLEVKVLYTNLTGQRAERPVDITRFALEKQEYDLLVTQPGLFENRFASLETMLTKSNTVFFNRYQKNIGSLFEPYGFFVINTENYTQMVRDAIAVQEFLTNNPNNLSLASVAANMFENSQVPASYFDFKNVQFRIQYIPYYNSRNIVRKLDTQTTNREMLRYYGQGDKVTSPQRALKKLFKTVQQMGNDQAQTSSRNISFELGDYTSEGYVLITKETFFNPIGATAKYLWSKNYQQISQFIGMNAEPRVFEIPLESYKRNVVLESYVELSTVNRENDSLFGSTLEALFMQTMQKNLVSSSPLTATTYYNPYLQDPDEFLFRNINMFVFDESVNQIVERPYLGDSVRVIKPLATSAGGNTINFYFEFDNPKSAASRQNRKFSKVLMDLIPYTKFDGSLDEYSFQLIRNYFTDDDRNFPVELIDNIPNEFNGFESRVLVHLDPAEILAQTYQLHVIPEFGKEETFIVGKYLTQHNNLWNPELGTDKFEVVSRNEPYNWADEYDTDSPSTGIDYTINVTRFRLNSDVQQKSWALVRKGTREIVFAVNQGDTKIRDVWFNFKRRRTGFIYEFSRPVYAEGTALPAPFTLTALTLSQTTVYFAWNYFDNVDFDEFIVRYTIDGEENFTTFTTTQFFTNISGLQPGTRYKFQVRARKGTDFSLFATAFATTQEGAPTAPSNLTASALSSFRVLLSWEDNSTNEYAFVIEKSDDGVEWFDPYDARSTGQDQTVFVWDGLEPNTTYYFRMRALSNGGFSTYSNTAQVTTAPLEQAAQPGVVITSVETDRINFVVTNTWNRLVNIRANVGIIPPTTTIVSNLAPNQSFSATIAGLSQNTNYNLFVQAIPVESGFTASTIFTFGFLTPQIIQAPPTPASLTFSNIGENSARANWSQVVEADGYRGTLQRTTGEDGSQIQTFVKTSNLVVVHDFSNLLPNTNYTVFVWARKADGQGGFAESQPIQNSFQTLQSSTPVPAAPSNLQISRSLTTNTLTWMDNSNNEDGFEIFFGFTTIPGNVPGFFESIGTTFPNTTSFQHIVTATGFAYYRVYSFNAGGLSTGFAEGMIAT
jgi:hypothetical protein